VIARWSQGIAANYMDEQILVELAELVKRHPWWLARGKLVLTLLKRMGVDPPAQILDAGCGWGVTLELLERQGYRTIGMDVSRQALEKLDRPDRYLVEADLSQPFHAHSPRNDAVLALDVIEHLDDDRGAIQRLGSLLRPGGALVVSVPALPEMFTEFDAIQGHRRRYLPEMLRAAFIGSDLRLDRMFWWGRWLVPALRRQRDRPLSSSGETPSEIYRRYLRLPPWPLLWVARLAFRAERELALRGMLPVGTSLIAVAHRPDAEHRTVGPF
jgi:2-polyprenyl-3-methyl-5-hydroxy-6-metoxy-1,4-benzoquinol methylase